MIPTEDDWCSEGELCLDTEWAYKNFHGKSHDEAVALFVDNVCAYTESLTYYMPSRVFGY